MAARSSSRQSRILLMTATPVSGFPSFACVGRPSGARGNRKRASVKPLKRGQDRKPCGEHHAHTDCNSEGLILDLPTQSVRCGAEIGSGYKLGHNELPGSLGMILWNAIITKVLG